MLTNAQAYALINDWRREWSADNEGPPPPIELVRRVERHLAAASTAPSGPIGVAMEFFKRQDEERAAWVKAGKCPTCHGDGVIGGQFCGGSYETCDACNGSGKPREEQ